MGRFRMLYRHCRITSSSAVNIKDEFLWRKDTTLLLMEYAKPTSFLCLDPSVKHETGLVNLSKISSRCFYILGEGGRRNRDSSRIHVGKPRRR